MDCNALNSAARYHEKTALMHILRAITTATRGMPTNVGTVAAADVSRFGLDNINRINSVKQGRTTEAQNVIPALPSANSASKSSKLGFLEIHVGGLKSKVYT